MTGTPSREEMIAWLDKRREETDGWLGQFKDSSKMLSAIRDLISAPQGWRDIKYAPRDGSSFLACSPGVRPEKCYFDQKTGKLCIIHLTFHTPQFELWMPLPAPPASEGKG